MSRLLESKRQDRMKEINLKSYDPLSPVRQ
ncbi:hypothetical protein D4764_10G0008970 [Takifugu flavidus]|uniref:Uncharacterized protein n=1 Tax=Takifugu flavidus TaxID=433684 RepID=A0A5C6PNC5_9TELE|nr:hypothetical protein D4764_10G0008970 [Takifugu flavidus]